MENYEFDSGHVETEEPLRSGTGGVGNGLDCAITLNTGERGPGAVREQILVLNRVKRACGAVGAGGRREGHDEVCIDDLR